MQLLIIGGTYFLGRVFTMLASQAGWSITMVNRGSYSMKSFGVQEFHFDRHEAAAWRSLPWQEYDAVVDFCAYEEGEIRTVVTNLPGTIGQYILISTCDVYERKTGIFQTEETPFSSVRYGGEAGQYIAQKILLERELVSLAESGSFAWTSIRPGMIYGPYNYAPRESLYIQMAVQHLPIPRITDANAQFQLVYVADVARGILSACANQKAFRQAYNLCAPELLRYDDFYAILEQASGETLSFVDQTAEEAIQSAVPLPFPVFDWETRWVEGSKACRELGITYTAAEEGMAKTYRAFLPVYRAI